MDRESLNDLIGEAARAAGMAATDEMPDAGWVLRDGDGGDTGVRSDGVLSRMVLSRTIGPLPPRDRVRACEMLLALNLAWPAHGGLWAGLDAARDEVVLSLDVPLRGLTPRTLARVLVNFLAGAGAWAEALGSFGRGGDPASGPDWIRI